MLLSLSACNTAGPHFRGLTATRIEVDGSVFDVRTRGNLAEAMRINPEYAPRFGPIRDRAAFAMSAVSGCDVTDVLGDQALATGVLACPPPLTGNTMVTPIGCRLTMKQPARIHDPPFRRLSCHSAPQLNILWISGGPPLSLASLD
ncbi:hypothetical protein [Sulfitobacter sp.]